MPHPLPAIHACNACRLSLQVKRALLRANLLGKGKTQIFPTVAAAVAYAQAEAAVPTPDESTPKQTSTDGLGGQAEEQAQA